MATIKQRKVKAILVKRLQRKLNENPKLEKQTQTYEIFDDEFQDCDEVSQSLGDFMISLMGNEGLMHIADNIFRYLNMYKLAYCRLVSRTFRDYIDNQRTMLKLQIKNFERFQLISYGCRYYDDVKVWDLGSGKWSPIFNSWGKFSYGHDVFDYIYQEVKDESELRTFLGLLREIASDRCHALVENPFSVSAAQLQQLLQTKLTFAFIFVAIFLIFELIFV